MKDKTKAHLTAANECLHEGRILIREESADGAVNRAYYAVYNAAMAALAEVGEAPKTHKGVHTRFSLRFVETDLFPKTVARAFAQAWRMRHKADYDAFTRFDTLAAMDLLGDVEAFVEQAEALVGRLTSGTADEGPDAPAQKAKE